MKVRLLLIVNYDFLAVGQHLTDFQNDKYKVVKDFTFFPLVLARDLDQIELNIEKLEGKLGKVKIIVWLESIFDGHR